MLAAVAFAAVGLMLIVLRRPISRLLLEWRALFPPCVLGRNDRTGETFLALLGAFALMLAVIAVVLS